MCSSDLFLCVLAILFPPLPVWVKRGICSADSIINILLLCLGFIPGLIHAWYIIAKFPDPEYDYDPVPQDAEGGRVRYIVIDRHNNCQHSNNKSQGNSRPGPNNNVNYGTASAPQQGQQQQPAASHPPQQQGVADSGEGSSSNNQGVPPSYAEVVAGDNKVQTHD
ncbi:unnamed protein product [Clonostachys rosea]|uniref:Stress response RCI peptide n=1 Tax=Bionectria ochroleuca TaxID=29856 RepID=A0ABY6TRC0_BIOOC|nr:unnamed protein product [Clonostachys rosea]